jgi:regulation of enolase protein 1 (concanavalin A-like superfamily)
VLIIVSDVMIGEFKNFIGLVVMLITSTREDWSEGRIVKVELLHVRLTELLQVVKITSDQDLQRSQHLCIY